MNIRTDLVTEIKEEKTDSLSNVKTFEETLGNAKISTVFIEDDNACKVLKKPKGIYCTVSFSRLDRISDTADIINAVVKSFKTVFNKEFKSALVVGLGNSDITPDALGPAVCNKVLATRHLSDNLKHNLGLDGLKSVSCISPGVLGKTGIESLDIINSAAKKVLPDVIIAVDALAARSPERLCRTIQISNSGICPGAGVNNSRKELSQKTAGVPVIAVGVPTVIDANGFFESKNQVENMMVTPKEIDLLIEKSSQILARALNIFLQPELDIDIIESLT